LECILARKTFANGGDWLCALISLGNIWGVFIMGVDTRLRSRSLQRDLHNAAGGQRKRRVDDVALITAASRLARNDPTPTLRIINKPISDVRASTRHVRKPSPALVQTLIGSIQEFGLSLPFLIDRECRLIAGHALLEAARKLGLEDVPCVVADHLSEDQARALAITLNRTAEIGEWDLDALKIELHDLKALDFKIEALGFTPQELDILLMESVAAEEPVELLDPDAACPAVSRAGDLWLLGEHRVLCADALDAGSYARLMAGRTAQGLFSDPPYNCPIEGFVSGLGKVKHADFAMAVGEMSNDAFCQFLQVYLEQCVAVLDPGAVIFACMDWRNIDILLSAGRQAGLSRINCAVWNKGSGGMGGLYRSAHEMIAVFCKGTAPATNNVALGKHGRDRTNVWTYPGANRRGSSAAGALGDHPTPKPVELVADALLDVTAQGDIVLDPFLGSGTTIIAAESAGRTAYGLGLDPRYVDVIVRRWQALSGGTAVHAEAGLSFDALACQRADAPDPQEQVPAAVTIEQNL
jgi:DNA modification methylase